MVSSFFLDRDGAIIGETTFKMFSLRQTSRFDFSAVIWSRSAFKFNAILCVFSRWGPRLRPKCVHSYAAAAEVIDCCQPKWWISLLPLSFDLRLSSIHFGAVAFYSLFIPISSCSGHSLWQDTSSADSLSVSERTAQARKLQCHSRGYAHWVLWHPSREREPCLYEQFCGPYGRNTPHLCRECEGINISMAPPFPTLIYMCLWAHKKGIWHVGASSCIY